MSARITEARTAQYELAIEIAAPRPRVWEALVEDTDLWWLPDFRLVGDDSTVSLRAEAGGALVEHRPDGASLLWYTVQRVEPGVSLHLVGVSSPEGGGPATTMLRLRLRDRGDGCLLEVSDALVGQVTEATVASLRDGWERLLGEGLRRYVERG